MRPSEEPRDGGAARREPLPDAEAIAGWLRDAGPDPREPAAQARAERWLVAFRESGVEGIGFGFVYLRAIDGPTELLAEDLQPVVERLAAEPEPKT